MTAYIDTFIAFCALCVSIIALRRIGSVREKVEEVHVTFNSRMTEFIRLVKQTARAEGVKEGREETKEGNSE